MGTVKIDYIDKALNDLIPALGVKEYVDQEKLTTLIESKKIKEAITLIQDDFEKILVITHINDFKDAFPVRLEIVKTPEGSTVYLN